jgi:hypothetical protein
MPSRSDDRPPWKRKNPAKTSTTLTPAQRAEARARARAAGRKYPNLVDNMAVARHAASTRKKASTKTAGSKKTRATKAR